jgi:hypothetical protein
MMFSVLLRNYKRKLLLGRVNCDEALLLSGIKRFSLEHLLEKVVIVLSYLRNAVAKVLGQLRNGRRRTSVGSCYQRTGELTAD